MSAQIALVALVDEVKKERARLLSFRKRPAIVSQLVATIKERLSDPELDRERLLFRPHEIDIELPGNPALRLRFEADLDRRGKFRGGLVRVGMKDGAFFVTRDIAVRRLDVSAEDRAEKICELPVPKHRQRLAVRMPATLHLLVAERDHALLDQLSEVAIERGDLERRQDFAERRKTSRVVRDPSLGDAAFAFAALELAIARDENLGCDEAGEQRLVVDVRRRRAALERTQDAAPAIFRPIGGEEAREIVPDPKDRIFGE